MTMGEPRYGFRLIRWTADDQRRLDEYERAKAAGIRRMSPCFSGMNVHDCPVAYETQDEAERQAAAALSLFPRATHAVIDLYEDGLSGLPEYLEELYRYERDELLNDVKILGGPKQ